jgi:NAD(P)-dependent dehydrogenase (short-subunit alcohol dehydrogenase family)
MTVLIVTGGSRGIGAAVARAAGARGFDVAVAYRRDETAANGVVDDITAAGGRARALQADVADADQVGRLFADVRRDMGPPSALVNSAGIGFGRRAVADFEADDLARLFAVNVTGTMICCREAVRAMSSRRGGSGGAIVNISSMAATIGGRPGNSAYAASKAAVDAFTIGLAKEAAADGIRVNGVRPGMTRTDMTSALDTDPARLKAVEATIPLGRVATPLEIAEPVLWLLSDAASFISGALVDASGGGFMVAG